MSEYEIPVSGGVNGLNVPLHGHLGISITQSPVIPNPESDATVELEKLKIDDTVYSIFPEIPRQVGYYTLDVQVTDNGKQLYWRRLAIPSNSLYPSDIQEV